MNSKELKRLSRRELVDIIYQLKKNEEEMQGVIESLEKELQDKRIRISDAGSIADASMCVTNVFAAAQMTADIYLDEISKIKEDTQRECAKKIDEAREKAKEIIAELKSNYKKDYAKWKRLQKEIARLEEKKKHELCEGIENG